MASVFGMIDKDDPAYISPAGMQRINSLEYDKRKKDATIDELREMLAKAVREATQAKQELAQLRGRLVLIEATRRTG